MQEEVKIIGAGLAGSEAALQLSKRGIKVKLYEMRPHKTTGAHVTSDCAEFVCSNSLGSSDITNASGLLKKEMEILGGELIKIAYENSVPAGNALAIAREDFSKAVTQRIENDPNIEIIREEVTEIPKGNVIIASGPLTSDKLADSIKKFTKSEHLHFFDAIAPIVEIDSINFDKAFWASRYDKGEASYINCPMNKEEYENFYNILINAPRIEQHDFEKGAKFFESCLPVEVLASRGVDTLRFGPMKPVGLIDKRTGVENYAVVQLRQDNSAKTLFNLVGFQTNLKWGAQKELIHSIPGLENANIIRYGVMHRNTFINSPQILYPTLEAKERQGLFFAGQITGTEGYTESIATGMLAGINMARRVLTPTLTLPVGEGTNLNASELTPHPNLALSGSLLKEREEQSQTPPPSPLPQGAGEKGTCFEEHMENKDNSVDLSLCSDRLSTYVVPQGAGEKGTCFEEHMENKNNSVDSSLCSDQLSTYVVPQGEGEYPLYPPTVLRTTSPARGADNLLTLPRETMLGALTFYITDIEHLKHISSRDNSLRYLPLQPTNSNWAIVAPIDLPKKDRKNKKLKTELLSKRSLEILENFINNC